MSNCRLAAVLSLMATAMLGGCGTTYSLKTFSPNDSGPRSAFIDIKQRAILAANRPGTQGAGQVPETVICAEPSPDSMSSFASELALDAKRLEVPRAEQAPVHGQRAQERRLGARGVPSLAIQPPSSDERRRQIGIRSIVQALLDGLRAREERIGRAPLADGRVEVSQNAQGGGQHLRSVAELAFGAERRVS